MALTDENGGGIPATMLVGPASIGGASMPYPYPVYGGNMGGSGQNGFGDNGWWIVLLIIVIAALGGNWGGNNGGSGFGASQPIIVSDGAGSSVQRGFDQAAVMAALSGIQSGICSGFGDVQNSLCAGFAGVNSTVNSGVNTIAQQLYANQIADMQQSFALQSQFAQCCCDNRLATESLRATVLSENCADRYAAAENTRDIIDSQTRSTQSILDKLCQLELDGKNDRIADLERQLTMANLSASQIAQTAQLRAASNDAVDALYNRLSNCPVPTEPVYGRQPIFTCPQSNNNGCGCGCGGNGF